jgi:Peptidase family M28
MPNEHRRTWAIATIALCLCACAVRTTRRPPLPGGSAPAELPPDLAIDNSCGVQSAEALSRCVDPMRIRADVNRIARPRSPGSEHHAAVRELCRSRLRELGFQVHLHSYASGENVIGTKLGFSKPTERVVLSAHYDNVGRCPGADDNASGVAAILEGARVLTSARFDRTLVVACWDEGENGQLGSTAYARAANRLEGKLRLVVALESVGYANAQPDTQQIPEGFEQLFPDQALAMLDHDYRADFLTVVADRRTMDFARSVVEHGGRFDLGVHILRLTDRIKFKQQDLHRSDHVSFWNEGLPAILLTDTGPFRNPRIGCKRGTDGPDSLDYEFASRVTRAGIGAVADALEVR